MTPLQESQAGLYGSWRLARGDVRGLALFNPTLQGFWRSFIAMIVVAPLFAWLLVLRYPTDGADSTPARFIAVQTISYVIAWFVFPLIMVYVARALERERRFFIYMVTYNWSSVLQNLIYLPLAIAAELEVLPIELASFLSFVALSLIFIYSWFIARTALAVTGWIAAAIVAGDFILSIVVNTITDILLRAG